MLVTSDARLYKFQADGSVDTSFGTAGARDLQPVPGSDPGFQRLSTALALTNGKILVGGVALDSASGLAGNTSFAVGRLNEDGSLDTSFALGRGWALANPDPNSFKVPVGMALQGDGRIVLGADAISPSVTGDYPLTGTAHHIVLARFLSDGSLDTSFGKQGIVIDTNAAARAVQMIDLPNGKILVAANDFSSPDGERLAIFRFNADGSRDTSFGGTGEVVSASFNTDSPAFGITVQSDGRIVVVGSGPADSADARLFADIGVARYNVDGSLDTSFGSNGFVSRFIAPDQGSWVPGTDAGAYGQSAAQAVHINDDGSILISGVTRTSDPLNVFRAQVFTTRLHSDGSVDTSFGHGGVSTTDLGDDTLAFLSSMTVKADGKIVLAVEQIGVLGGPFIPVIVEYDAHGLPDLGFGDPAASLANTIGYAQGRPDQFINPTISVGDTELDALASYAGASVSLARHGGANADDQFVGGAGLSLRGGNATVDGVVVGTVVSGAGSLRIDFNSNASPAVVTTVLRSIVYQDNATFADQQSIQIDWTFSDGNVSAIQGTGGALSAITSTNVTLHANGTPYWIDSLLNRGSASQSADQLRQSLLSALGPSHGLDLHFATDGTGAPFSATDQAFLRQTLAELSSVANLPAAAGGAPLTVHSAASGTATSILDATGAQLYFSAGTIPQSNEVSALRDFEQALGLKLAADPGAAKLVLPSADSHADLTVLSDGAALHASTGLGPLDVAALQFLFGPNHAARSGNDSYQLSATQANFIWDGAGIDTITGAGLSQDIRLHLEPGHWDSLGGQANSIDAPGQITINYGSEIENAIGGDGNDELTGNALANFLSGGAGKDTLAGGAGNDTLNGGAGNDVLDGGVGLNTAAYSGLVASYQVARTAGGWQVADLTGADGVDQLSNIARLHFSDRNLALDIDGAAGEAYRLYQAAFNRVPDQGGLGFWISALDSGVNVADVATSFINSAEFRVIYGSAPSTRDEVTAFYTNVLHRAPDAGGIDFWVSVLDSHAASVATVLLGFSDSAEYKAALVGVLSHGIAYVPFGA
ncbi:MAG: DUF4214 domain-containing protein [Pseudomonadota bacterium]